MHRLTPTDASFLHIEDGDHSSQMHIGNVAIFEGPAPTHQDFTDGLLDRLHLIPRYRQRIQAVPFELARPDLSGVTRRRR
jgi:diacylglycerol O-acyltransferase